ncbi:hypothetical protein CWI37_1473p0020 [Hamiltosporidium tvaerminnensis]|uniref:Uncharacterized protein n=1 Tax=Hamiltosporidium tvaerminnensis TaxID=1176355 RepID=A0A4Q9KWS1_9MICR|nr:hypothetical protein LUQ84_002420 [Hamiltosporidium tvaerminnensis]TBT99085.1 hypothetical protein CWI37_1473p0020 [Hamiltosporidium tvaerminnensis]
MEIIKLNPIPSSLSSVYLQNDDSTVICAIFISEKQPSEKSLEIIFESLNNTDDISKIIYTTIVNNLTLHIHTQIRICFYCLEIGKNLLETLINSYTISILNTGLPQKDMLVSSTIDVDDKPKDNYSTNNRITLVYSLHNNSITQIYFNHKISAAILPGKIEILIEKCQSKGEQIKEYFNKKYF